jgi:predicted small secreted protein
VQFCRLIFAFALAALVTACAATQPAGDSIKSRAQARWDALLASDYDTAYGFYSPGYRTSHSRTDFEIELRSRRVRWVGAEVLEASCEADVCSVETRVDYKIARPVPGVPEWKSSDQLTERWVRIDGQWWFLPDK